VVRSSGGRGSRVAHRRDAAADHRVDGQIRRIAGSNATPIEVREDAGVVYTSAFELVVLDDQGQRWVVSLTASQWR